MIDFQSATADIRRGIKKKKKDETTKNIMSTSATQGGHWKKDSNHRAVHRAAITTETSMRANAQRDGSPAEYRWRPLFNAAKFG